MLKKVLIVEDNPHDIRYYQSLFAPEREVSLLFLTHDEHYTKEKLLEIIELFCENFSSKIKNCFVRTKDTILEFLKSNHSDFYVVDSLEGFADQLVAEANLPKEKTAFLSSTSSFRELMRNKGYLAY